MGFSQHVQHEDVAVLYEAMAMACGACTVAVVLLSTYLNRRNMVAWLDCVATFFWVLANYVWMCGEFFLRYHNMQQVLFGVGGVLLYCVVWRF
jgi:hypothetical protein